MAPNSKIDASTAVIIKHMNKLLTMNVPAAISILHGGKIHHFGSKFTKMFLKSCPELKLELEKDALVLCRGEGELTEQCRIATEDDDKATDAVVIPAPIELLNRKEIITALRDLIVYDHNNGKNRTTKGGKWIKYGQSDWQPSFWPNRLWNWSKIKNFGKLKVEAMNAEGLGNKFATLVDFFKYVVEIGFDQLDLDPTECLANTFDEKEERKRKKIRHIKSIPTAKSPEVDDSVDDSVDGPVDGPVDDSVDGSVDGAVEGPADTMKDLPTSEEEFVGHQYEYRESPCASNTEVTDPYVAEATRDNSKHVEEITTQERNEGPANIYAEPMMEGLFSSVDTEEIPAPPCIANKLWENAVIIRNGKGSSTIPRAAVQSFGLAEGDFWKLKLLMHENIIANFSEYRHLYPLPLHLQDESGSRMFHSESELLSYLRSAGSVSVHNFPIVEILVLANILGARVFVLHQKGETTQKYWKWSNHSPASPECVDKQGKYYTGRELCLITENNFHFYLLTSSSSTLPRTVPEQDNGEDDAVIAESEEALDTERFAMVPIGNLKKRAKSNHPDSRSDSELRRSTRVSKKTERFQQFTREKRKGKGQKSQNKRRKNDGDTIREENVDMELLEHEHEHEMHDINDENDALSDLNRRMLCQKMEQRKLIDMGQELKVSLSNENIRQIFCDNLEYFKDIRNGKVKTWRSTWYNNGKEQSLIGHLLAGPFTNEQQDTIYEEVKKNFLKAGIPDRFVDFVLTPEVYIRIYQVFFQLSKEEAEQNLKHQYLYYIPSGSESSSGVFIK